MALVACEGERFSILMMMMMKLASVADRESC